MFDNVCLDFWCLSIQDLIMINYNSKMKYTVDMLIHRIDKQFGELEITNINCLDPVRF